MHALISETFAKSIKERLLAFHDKMIPGVQHDIFLFSFILSKETVFSFPAFLTCCQNLDMKRPLSVVWDVERVQFKCL